MQEETDQRRPIRMNTGGGIVFPQLSLGSSFTGSQLPELERSLSPRKPAIRIQKPDGGEIDIEY